MYPIPTRYSRAIDQTAAHFGRLDGLVNNAGIADFGPIAQTGFDIWQAIMATNLSGPFLTVQAAAPVMLRSGGGAIVNIASISGHRASTLRVAYGTSKAGSHPPHQATGGGVWQSGHPGKLRMPWSRSTPRWPKRFTMTPSSARAIMIQSRSTAMAKNVKLQRRSIFSISDKASYHQRPGPVGGRRL